MTEVRAVAARSGVGPRYSEWPAPGPNPVPLPPASGRSSFLVPTSLTLALPFCLANGPYSTQQDM